MAKYLKVAVKCFIMTASLMLVEGAGAEVLNDPTRPPAGALAQGAGEQALVDMGPVLQAVSISSQRKSATISGQEVLLGGKYGEAKLIRVRDGEVVLRNPDGSRETLRMYPGIEKTLVKHKGPVRRDKSRMRAEK